MTKMDVTDYNPKVLVSEAERTLSEYLCSDIISIILEYLPMMLLGMSNIRILGINSIGDRTVTYSKVSDNITMRIRYTSGRPEFVRTEDGCMSISYRNDIIVDRVNGIHKDVERFNYPYKLFNGSIYSLQDGILHRDDEILYNFRHIAGDKIYYMGFMCNGKTDTLYLTFKNATKFFFVFAVNRGITQIYSDKLSELTPTERILGIYGDYFILREVQHEVQLYNYVEKKHVNAPGPLTPVGSSFDQTMVVINGNVYRCVCQVGYRNWLYIYNHKASICTLNVDPPFVFTILGGLIMITTNTGLCGMVDVEAYIEDAVGLD